uniref:FIIND domain-containing protein n=1 Tax=Varanus komodoensis TaxID=61221 RepID=A0A8D2Q7F9_VARKO
LDVFLPSFDEQILSVVATELLGTQFVRTLLPKFHLLSLVFQLMFIHLICRNPVSVPAVFVDKTLTFETLKVAFPPPSFPVTCRLCCPEAGTYLCSETELRFEVRGAVTLTYAYGSWDQHLSRAEKQKWMVAGPLFDIQADPAEEVAAVHLPHFICLEGKVDISQMKVGHLVEEGLLLETPSQVNTFHVVVENPTFSLIGVLICALFRFSVNSLVLLYRTFKPIVTLRLYLIPNDNSVKYCEVSFCAFLIVIFVLLPKAQLAEMQVHSAAQRVTFSGLTALQLNHIDSSGASAACLVYRGGKGGASSSGLGEQEQAAPSLLFHDFGREGRERHCQHFLLFVKYPCSFTPTHLCIGTWGKGCTGHAWACVAPLACF